MHSKFVQFSIFWIKTFFLVSFVLFYIPVKSQNPPVITHRFFNGLDGPSIGGKWTNDKKAKGIPHSWDYFSIIDQWKPFSIGLDAEIPNDLKNKNFRISVHGWIRTSNVAADNQLIISVTRRDSTIAWQSKNIAALFGKPGVWMPFSDSVFMPRS